MLPGERLLWIGTPGRGLIFHTRDFFVVPFSLVWCGISIAPVWSGSQPSGPSRLFELPSVLIGLYLLFGRFILDIWSRRRTSYAVTDQRILIQRDRPFGAFVSRDLAGLSEIFLLDEKRTRGTLRFGPAPWPTEEGAARSEVSSLDGVPQFIAIDGAGDVLHIVLEASRAARAAETR